MSWETSIKGFKSYLQIERSLSDNSVQAYTSDVKKFANYAIPLNLSELKITRENISNFLSEIKISVGNNKKRKLGKVLSKRIYEYIYCGFILQVIIF